MKINPYSLQNTRIGSRLLLGAHFSIAGGYHEAAFRAFQLECCVLQIFTKNASTWREKSIDAESAATFRQACRKAGIVFKAAHAGYLINPASPDIAKWNKSCHALECEVERAAALGLDALVLHPGSHLGAGIAAGTARVVAALGTILEKAARHGVRLLLETTAGQGFCLGYRFEHLAAVIKALGNPENIGVCLDTCHVFAAGYDLRTPEACLRTFDRFDRVLGLGRLALLHCNDSAKPMGSRVDRHAHIGRGMIGIKGFAWLMQNSELAGVAKILETPKTENGRNMDRVNLELLRSLAGAEVCQGFE